mmetsp:Transcript_10509/g.15607  ORF Transcript_10509/g.15607 Transcript_10509/m.15607 type:complete len:352 (-) Transcript_10509:1183-2238(-)
MDEDILSFVAEWYDPRPQLVKQYLLKCFTKSEEVEMKELATGRKFLKRTRIPSMIKVSDFVVGNNILLFSRDLKLVDYGDSKTRKLLDASSERTTVFGNILRTHLGQFLKFFEDEGLAIADTRSFSVRSEHDFIDIEETIGMKLKKMEDERINLVVSVQGRNAIRVVHGHQESLRAKFGSQIMCASSQEDAEQLHSYLSSFRSPTATYESCTCCVIKPHVIKARESGALIEYILSQGFGIGAIHVFHLSHTAADEFYSAYKSVLHNYNDAVSDFCTGPIIALEVRAMNAVQFFRKIAGPWDVGIAKELFPDTIRARFGVNHVQNAIHCTDIPEDASLELSYFFDVLANSER